ncbi:hypothetical protein [Mycolicibacterium sediminis]|uniref:Uncharacterized protein n=1 Tax=Mycolicibacterium sediminis TaxID=1286180 RepID=A0A7I7R0I7_9MYCO|nr:hypothetical protein [Mycolicibacterium sediminis]BBY31666.1 hypothetical protein MSEDJ_57620 [Mycolicibacterium sediminis]
MAKRPGISNYWVPLLGLVCIGGGVATFGILLAVAGGDSGWLRTIALLVAAVALCGGGYWMMARSGKQAGGWRMTSMDPEEKKVYRAEFRGFNLNRLRRASGAAKPEKPRH